MVQELEELGFLVLVKDVSVFPEIPVYECQFYPMDHRARFTGGRGWGCHPVPEIAITRALLEANQARTIIISGSRDDMHKSIFLRERVRQQSPKVIQALHQQLPIAEPMLDSPFEPMPLDAYLPSLVGLLSSHGFSDIFAVPLTLPDELVHVVKVIVPGFEGYQSSSYRPVGAKSYSNGPFAMGSRLAAQHRFCSIGLNAGGVM
jgi:ribosomal protein S12 methylthiotransferase accessory factor